MKDLVRGGSVLIFLSLFVVFVYANDEAGTALDIANDSQVNILENSIVNNDINNSYIAEASGRIETEQFQEQDRVKKTGSSRVSGGVSKGSFIATAYCLRGRTAMGHAVRSGLIAADPRVLPLGSRINLGAGNYSGAYLVSDTGGSIKGRRLDIWMASCAEAKRFGRRTVTVSSLGR